MCCEVETRVDCIWLVNDVERKEGRKELKAVLINGRAPDNRRS